MRVLLPRDRHRSPLIRVTDALQLGVVKFFRANVPPLIEKFNTMKETPLGRYWTCLTN